MAADVRVCEVKSCGREREDQKRACREHMDEFRVWWRARKHSYTNGYPYWLETMNREAHQEVIWPSL